MDGMSELLQTKDISEGLMDALVHQAAVDREVERLSREFVVWQRQRQIKDGMSAASILRSWGFQVGEA
jgi:hypothetical protein